MVHNPWRQWWRPHYSEDGRQEKTRKLSHGAITSSLYSADLLRQMSCGRRSGSGPHYNIISSTVGNATQIVWDLWGAFRAKVATGLFRFVADMKYHRIYYDFLFSKQSIDDNWFGYMRKSNAKSFSANVKFIELYSSEAGNKKLFRRYFPENSIEHDHHIFPMMESEKNNAGVRLGFIKRNKNLERID